MGIFQIVDTIFSSTVLFQTRLICRNVLCDCIISLHHFYETPSCCQEVPAAHSLSRGHICLLFIIVRLLVATRGCSSATRGWRSHVQAIKLPQAWSWCESDQQAFHQTYCINLPIGISRFVCVGCDREGQFSRLFQTRRAASTHVGMSRMCWKLGLGVREISVGAGTGAYVMAGWAGAAGPATDLWHQLPGISHSKQRISQNIV